MPPLLALVTAVLLLITWGDRAISPPGIALFYNPMWACGDAPPFLVVDISVNREQYRGTAMRLFRHGTDLHADGQPGAAPGSFLVCEGRIKKIPCAFSMEQQGFIDRMLYGEESLVP